MSNYRKILRKLSIKQRKCKYTFLNTNFPVGIRTFFVSLRTNNYG